MLRRENGRVWPGSPTRSNRGLPPIRGSQVTPRCHGRSINTCDMAFIALQCKHGTQTRCWTADPLQKTSLLVCPGYTERSEWHSHRPRYAARTNTRTAKDRQSIYNLFWTVWRHDGRRAYHSWCCQTGVRMKSQLISISIFSRRAPGKAPPNY